MWLFQDYSIILWLLRDCFDYSGIIDLFQSHLIILWLICEYVDYFD